MANSGARITPTTVHESLSKYMLVDGFDLVIDLEKSKGSKIVDSRHNRELLDMFSFFASNPVGMNHPRLLEPSFLETLTKASIHKPSNSDIYTVEMAQFVEAFGRLALPSYMKHLFFVSGGGLAVENALKAAFDWKVRKNFKKGHMHELGSKVIHFREAFHGRTGYTLSLTNTDPVKTQYFPKFDWPRINNPKIEFPLEDNLAAVEAAEAAALAQIRDAFVRFGEDIAAIIIEPIQGEGGDNHFRGEFLRALRKAATENGAMLVLDEIQTGLGLTGKMWCTEHFDLKPDMLCFGKKTQVCGFACTDRIDEIEDNVFAVSSRINSTWGGNLADMVRCTRFLEIINEEKLVDNAQKMGARLLEGLQTLQDQFSSLVCNARGRGLMCAFDMCDPNTRNALFSKTYEKGLMVLKTGVKGIRFRPALNVTKGDIDDALSRLEDAISQL